MEVFRVLKLSQLDSFRALLLTLFKSFRTLSAKEPKLHFESFRVLILTLMESVRALRLRIEANVLPKPLWGALKLRMVTTCLSNPSGGPYGKLGAP